MPAKPPPPSEQSAAQLHALGEQLRARRKVLRVSSTAAAEAAGMSRVTLHRIEKGEPSVTAGAWANAMAALGMKLLASQRRGHRCHRRKPPAKGAGRLDTGARAPG